jgi:hypothetical protein
MMLCGRRDDQIGLRKCVTRLAALFHQQPPLDHDVFGDRQYSLIEHRPYLVGQPGDQFGAATRDTSAALHCRYVQVETSIRPNVSQTG